MLSFFLVCAKYFFLWWNPYEIWILHVSFPDERPPCAPHLYQSPCWNLERDLWFHPCYKLNRAATGCGWFMGHGLAMSLGVKISQIGCGLSCLLLPLSTLAHECDLQWKQIGSQGWYIFFHSPISMPHRDRYWLGTKLLKNRNLA